MLAGLGLSFVAMGFAAFGYIPPVAGALLQEGIDVAVILNALRALRGLSASTPSSRDGWAGRRTINTEHDARWATRSLTLPSALRPVRPRLPITISDAPASSATSTMRRCAGPVDHLRNRLASAGLDQRDALLGDRRPAVEIVADVQRDHGRVVARSDRSSHTSGVERL